MRMVGKPCVSEFQFAAALDIYGFKTVNQYVGYCVIGEQGLQWSEPHDFVFDTFHY